MNEKEFMERMKRAKEKVKDGILTPMVDMLPEDREYAAGVYVGVDIGSGDDMEETTTVTDNFSLEEFINHVKVSGILTEEGREYIDVRDVRLIIEMVNNQK
jgi:isopentenyl phosphate kinase